MFGTLTGMGKPINEVLAENIGHWMALRPELSTQMALAKKSGVNQKTISNYLRPNQRLEGKLGRPGSAKLTEVELIARAFGIEVWELLKPVKLRVRVGAREEEATN